MPGFGSYPRRGFVAVALCVAALGAPRHAPAQPNIIHIVADDFGWVDVAGGSTNYGHGSNYYQTPNLDALAARGMSFTSAYTQQNCVPTRAAMLTGQYAPRTGIHNVGSLNRSGDDTLLVAPEDGEHLAAASITLAETLGAAGYTTAHFGKFHVADNRVDIATQHGFQVNMEVSNGASGTSHMAVNSGTGWTFGVPEYDAFAQPYTQSYVDTQLAPLANGNNPNLLVGTAKHLADGVTDAARQFIATNAAAPQPFYINLAYSAVHAPITPRADLAAKYGGLASTDPRHTDAAYGAFVETLDQAVARVAAAIDDPNGDGDNSDSIAANTLLVFTSDNGGHMGDTNNSPLRERKGTLREGGIRVPMIAVMPGTIPAASITDEAVHAVDIYPTYAELAGAPLPTPQAHTLDGESFAGILSGQQTQLDREAIFWHFPGYLDSRTVPTSIITKDVGANRFKLLYFYEDAHYELFNLTNDLSETTDLLDTGSPLDYAIAREMSADLRGWLDDQNALYPTVRATGAPVPPPTPLPASPPAVELTFALGRDPATPDQAAHELAQGGVTLSLAAVGSNALLDWNNNGVGVNSNQDTGTATDQRRINGELATPEAIRFSFDADVAISSMLLGSISTNATESVVLSFVSGTNPFLGLDGYTGDYALTATSLTFTPTGGAAPLLVPFGEAGQDTLLVTAGTVLSITANPATAQGILFDEITVVLVAPSLDGDFNQDGLVDATDYVLWRKSAAGAGYDTWRANFGRTLAGGGHGISSGTVPEPHAAAMLALAAAAIAARPLRAHRARNAWSKFGMPV